jgi:hypothetical protein
MFLQKLFASIRVRRRGSAQQHIKERGSQLPKRWQELLAVAKPKQVETPRPVVRATEANRLHDKTGT